MAKNILLMFLSDVKFRGDAVSVANYKDIGTTKTTNESAVRYLAKKDAKPSKIFYFASNKVREILADFKDGGGTFHNFTHVSYFRRRIADCVDGRIDEVMQPYNFNEKSDIQQTMKAVIEMASRIQSYVQTQSEKVILHVDMTGGLRHASLMMLVIARLIQYSGVKIGYVLYSNFVRGREENFVEEVNEIYNLFDLISGAEEFVRFGSVNAILSYFDDKDIPPVLKNLLDAMKKFAEVIKISRRKEFQDALKNLRDAYQNFNDAATSFSTITNAQSLNYNLMQQMKIRIEAEYSTLLTCDADDYISIIGWCLAHGYVQPSLVLYTEAFPYLMIAKNKILSVNSMYADELAKKVANDGMGREQEFFLLNVFEPDGYNRKPIFKAYEKFIKELKKAIAAIRSGSFDKATFDTKTAVARKEMIPSDVESYKKLLDELQTLKTDSDTARADKIFEELEQTEVDALKIKTNNTLIIYHMLRSGILVLNRINEEDFLKIVDRYFRVKSERNDSVHATQRPKELLGNAKPKESYAAFLKNFLQQGLDEYSDIVTKI